MLKRICVLCFIAFAAFLGVGWRGGIQQDLDILANNRCVSCHSKITSPLSLSQRYYDWHLSLHKDKGVGCNKCHGGDPTTEDEKKAHHGVFPATDPQSSVNLVNLPETCGACHDEIANSFIESTHYQKLKAAGMGPSCTTCHAHMASAVVKDPTETAALCATCHNTINGMLPARPEIPDRAKEVMEALNRASAVLIWADRLLEVGAQRKLDMSEEKAELKEAKSTLTEAKVGWHALSFESIRQKADEAFEVGTEVKDQLLKKINLSSGQ